jgi:hypothetical protein
MRIILLSLLVLANGYILPRYRNNIIFIKSTTKSKCFDDEIIYLKNKLKRLENVKNKIEQIIDQNLNTIKEIIEEEYSTEWDFYNQTWNKNE